MMMVEVCNGTTAGGSYRFAPDADPADGKLDVCLIRRVHCRGFLLAIRASCVAHTGHGARWRSSRPQSW